MTCPVCNAQSSAMSVRCLECGTILIQEAVARPDDVQRTVDAFDKRMYMGYGGLLGFAIGIGSWFVFSRDENVVKSWLMVSGVIGAALGRLFACQKRNLL